MALALIHLKQFWTNDTCILIHLKQFWTNGTCTYSPYTVLNKWHLHAFTLNSFDQMALTQMPLHVMPFPPHWKRPVLMTTWQYHWCWYLAETLCYYVFEITIANRLNPHNHLTTYFPNLSNRKAITVEFHGLNETLYNLLTSKKYETFNYIAVLFACQCKI